MEKLGKSNRTAIDKRASSFLNDHARRDFQRKSRRSSDSAWSSREGTEKLEQAKRSAMANQAIRTPNGYFCQKLQTRRWSKLTKTRLRSLNADISPRYLQSSPLLLRNHLLSPTPLRGEQNSQIRAPNFRKSQKLRRFGAR